MNDIIFDPIENPFSPGAGAPPPELAGREKVLDRAKLSILRIKNGKSEKSFFLVGLRGVGKTVLLRKIEEIAIDEKCFPIMIEVREDKNLVCSLVPKLRKLLFSMKLKENVGNKLNRAIKVLKGFAIRMTPEGNVEFGLDIEPERGTADSGDLENDLTELFEVLGEVAQEKKTAIVIIIDEIQYLNTEELSSLIMAVHKITQRKLPVIALGAGLPQFLGKAGNAKSYAERLFDYPPIGQLSEDDAKKALQAPLKFINASFTEDAIREISRITQNYPYFLQEWGYQSWENATTNPIDKETIVKVTEIALERLDKNFFQVRFDRLTPKEKDYLRNMAELGGGPHKSGEIAKLVGVKTNSVAPVRNSLIKKGMIFSPNYGETEFTVPLFADYMKRVMK